MADLQDSLQLEEFGFREISLIYHKTWWTSVWVSVKLITFPVYVVPILIKSENKERMKLWSWNLGLADTA